uniref:Uncharacterized protein n=1 Tax=Meloidogyne enterolobii TaxID=390850 RepID=A0A6V7VNA9_MELEN|nr:unnamed protein product [Meloidogyne enterolobii]
MMGATLCINFDAVTDAETDTLSEFMVKKHLNSARILTCKFTSPCMQSKIWNL